MKRAGLFTLLLFSLCVYTEAQNLILNPLYHSAEIIVGLPNGFDDDQTAFCKVEYRETGSGTWREAYGPERIEWQLSDQFRGSLFNLMPNQSYEVRIWIIDSIPSYDTTLLPTESFTTLADPQITIGQNVYWVSPSGSGTDYTEQNPGDLKTLIQSGITCGTTIYLMDGIYATGSLIMNIWQDCSPTESINILAAAGAKPILDGGYYTALNWNQSGNDSLLFSAGLPAEAAWTNLLLLDSVRLFPYSTVQSNAFSGNYHLLALNYEFDGFVRDNSTIYLKTASGINPNQVEVVLSQYFRGLTVNGMGHDIYLNMRGIQFRNYSKSQVDLNGAFTARALHLRGVNHVLLDSCSFFYNNDPLVIEGGGANITVQNCHIKDQTGLWKHAMFKKSVSNQSIPYASSFGRGLENAGILFKEGVQDSRNIVYRNNTIDGLTNGVAFATGNVGIQNLDIYGNTFINCFDGIETDGRFLNLRVYQNDVSHILAGISLAPPSMGPVYVFRNVFHHIISRENESDDPVTISCQPPTTYTSGGQGIKTNSGAFPEDAAALHFIHNTFHSEDTLGFTLYNWDSEWGFARFINNCYYFEQNETMFFTAILNDSSFQIYSENDNYYREPSGPVAVIKEIHGQYNCHEIWEIDSLEDRLKTVSQSDHIEIKSPLAFNPDFADPAGGNFELNAASPLIDAGLKLPGFYDFLGENPDIGAIEADSSFANSEYADFNLRPQLNVYPNPAKQFLIIESAENLEHIALYSMLGQHIFSKNPLNATEYHLPLQQQSGLYLLRIQAGGKWAEHKIIILED